MAAGSDFIFALQNKANEFWQLDSSGAVTINAQPYFLRYASDGWQDITIQNVLNQRLWAVDRMVSMPQAYLGDGAKILKYIFYTLGTEEEVYLTIAGQQLEYNPGVSYGYWYKRLYRGEVDLSDLKHDGVKVTCRTLEDGLPKYLKANENTVFEFPMNVPEAIFVKMDGIRLHEKLNYSMTDGVNYVNAKYTPSFQFINSEGNNTGIVFQSQNYQPINAVNNSENDYVATSPNYFFANETRGDLEVHIQGSLHVKSNRNDTGPLSSSMLVLKTNQPNGSGGTVDYNIFLQPMLERVEYTFDVDMTIVVPKGIRLFFMGRTFSVNDSQYQFEYLPQSNISLSFKTIFPTTYIKAFPAQYLFDKLIERATEGNYLAGTCEYFRQHEGKVFTCGNAIRGLTDAVMKISLNDFFHDWNCYDSVGMSEVFGKVYIDRKQNLIQRATPIILAPPADGTFSVSLAKDMQFNEVEYGYPEIRNEVGVLNGREEFNCKYLFSLGTSKSPAKLDRVTKIKASPYEIEQVRTTMFEKNTTDFKADNDNYSLAVERFPVLGQLFDYHNLDRSLNVAATGLLEPETVFNIPLSPKRNLKRNGPYYRSALYKADNKVLQYRTCDKNNKMVADGIAEAVDEPIADLGERFFIPLILEGDFPAPENLESLLELNPLQVFRFEVDHVWYDGILLEVSASPSSRKVQHFRFYCDYTNDITKLIEYNG